MGANENKPILGNKEKIFLTGHTGFKGTWLTLLLESMGHEVVGYSLKPAEGSLFERLNRNGKIQEFISDIRDSETLTRAVHLSKPTIAIHMAAQPLVLESYRIPADTIEINGQGTSNLLNAAFTSGTVRVVGAVTTDKVYKNLETHQSYDETDALEGTSDPYSASKVAAEAIIRGWTKVSDVSGGPKIVTLRSGNVIGGGDFSVDRLIPDLVRGHMFGETVQIRNPASTRPWMHVLDSLVGYLRAIEHSSLNNKSEIFNFAPSDQSLSVREIIDTALQNWPGMFEYQIQEASENKMEASFLNLNSTKAGSELGWHPHWTQKESVESTINWWRKILLGQTSALNACNEEIRECLS